jgi:hypothetical protein
MEADILKNFIKQDVEVLVGGVWIEGHLLPIVKNIVTLVPIGVAKEHYGPTACKMEVIQAIRQVRRPAQTNTAGTVPNDPNPPAPVRSGFEPAQQGHPGSRFVHKDNR